MYRHRAASGGVRERRNQPVHPAYAKPELMATGPNQVWSWDITKLKGPAKWTCFHLYVILNIYSRYIVGWMIADRECSILAKQLIGDTVALHGVVPGTLTLHADRGTTMRSKTVSDLLVDLVAQRSHSRPHVSDDNPYSEAQFKTLKYRPGFPDRFGCTEDARADCQAFFPWYHDQHRHSGIGYMTPHNLHFGFAQAIRDTRQTVLGYCVPCSSEAVQAKKTSTRHAACGSVDQSTETGARHRHYDTTLQSNFITPSGA